MKCPLITLLGLWALTACNSTPTLNHTSLPLTEAELLSGKWQKLQRKEPRYPLESAIAGNEGCATVEYVITADYAIEDIKVLESSNRYFAKQAKKSIARWNWSQLDKGIISTPVKTRTRFEFCIDNENDNHCSAATLITNATCSGKDVITAVGRKSASPTKISVLH